MYVMQGFMQFLKTITPQFWDEDYEDYVVH